MKTSIKLCRRQLSCSTSVAALLAGAVIAGGISPAGAAPAIWSGAASGNWFANGNWSTNQVPTAADTAYIDTTSPNATTMNGGKTVMDCTDQRPQTRFDARETCQAHSPLRNMGTRPPSA